MLYEYAVLSCIGGDDGSGSGVLLAYGQTESIDKVFAIASYYKQFGGYVIHGTLYGSNYGNDDGVGQ